MFPPHRPQLLIALQPQLLPMQVGPVPAAEQVAGQLTQLDPAAPHAVSTLPGWQAVPSQHPPLQASPPVHSEEHLPLLQACRTPHSPGTWQPHRPLTQLVPRETESDALGSERSPRGRQ